MYIVLGNGSPQVQYLPMFIYRVIVILRNSPSHINKLKHMLDKKATKLAKKLGYKWDDKYEQWVHNGDNFCGDLNYTGTKVAELEQKIYALERYIGIMVDSQPSIIAYKKVKKSKKNQHVPYFNSSCPVSGTVFPL